MLVNYLGNIRIGAVFKFVDNGCLSRWRKSIFNRDRGYFIMFAILRYEFILEDNVVQWSWAELVYEKRGTTYSIVVCILKYWWIVV